MAYEGRLLVGKQAVDLQMKVKKEKSALRKQVNQGWLRMSLLGGEYVRCLSMISPRTVRAGQNLKQFNFLLVQQLSRKLLLNTFKEDLYCRLNSQI